jgi:hypothetical protein
MKVLFQVSAGTGSQLSKAKRRDIYNVYEQINKFIKKLKNYNYLFLIIKTNHHNFLRKRALRHLIDTLIPTTFVDNILLDFLIKRYYIPVFFLNLFQQQVLSYTSMQQLLWIFKTQVNKEFLPYFVYKYFICLNTPHNGCRCKKQRKI